MEIGPEIRELMDRIKSVPPFLGRHYFCKYVCEDFLKEVADLRWPARHWRLLKEGDYVTYKYVVKPYLQTMANYGQLIAKLMETDAVYLALIWNELTYYVRSIFRDMMLSKEGHRQCVLNGQATLRINRYGDVTIEYGYCKKEIPYTYRKVPSSQLRERLRARYCPNVEEGDVIACTIDITLLPEVIVMACPRRRDHELLDSALKVVEPILEAVTKSDRWTDLWFLWDAVDFAMYLLSVKYGLSGFTFEGLLAVLEEDLGLKAIPIYHRAFADMRPMCYETACDIGRGEKHRLVKLGCPIEKVGTIGVLSALYKDDPEYVYKFMRPYIEEELFKKSQ